MHLARRLALLVPTLIVLACGGSVTKIGTSDAGGDGPSPSCPSVQIVAAGAACSESGVQCPAVVPIPTCNGGSAGTTTVTCTCESGDWQCPVFTGAPCPSPTNVCPDAASVVPGGGCGTDPGLSCASNAVISTCGGTPQHPAGCSCVSNAWVCASLPVCVVDAGVNDGSADSEAPDADPDL